jgi:hypothetical protein
MSRKREAPRHQFEVMTDLVYEPSQDFKIVKERAELSSKGAILLLVTVYPGVRQQANWRGHRFTPHMIRALNKFAQGDSSAIVRLRATVVLEYLGGLKAGEAARRLGRGVASWYLLIGSLIRHGVSRAVLESPFRRSMIAALSRNTSGRAQSEAE